MAGRVPSTMRAAVARAFGGPEVVRVAKDVPVPRLAPDEVLVRVAAASVSPLDARVRAGYARALYAPMLPLILGRDVSGEVVARGDSARSFPLGAQVFGALSPLAPRGAHAEFVAVREAHLAPKPRAWTHAQAAAVPFAALTAWRALFADADLRPGERLLVHGLGSTVGGLAAQLAYARGAAAVAGSVGARSRARVRKNVPNIPNANLWTYDDTAPDAAPDTAPDANANVPLRSLAAAAAHHAWAPFDVALDLVGEARSEKRLARLLRRGRGRLVTAHGDLARLVGERGSRAAPRRGRARSEEGAVSSQRGRVVRVECHASGRRGDAPHRRVRRGGGTDAAERRRDATGRRRRRAPRARRERDAREDRPRAVTTSEVSA